MFPKLLEVGPVSLYTYGILLAASYLLGLKIAVDRGERRGISRAVLMDLGIYVIVAAFLGAKLLLVLVEFDQFLSSPRELLTLFRAGGVFYGGLILASLVTIWYVRRHRLPVWHVADAAAPGIALGHVTGRLGCFLAGCCYGRPTDVPWAVTFSDPVARANVGTPLGVPLHPTQLYEAGAELLILVGLLAFERRGRAFPGRTFAWYLIAYGITRFVIEFYRGDPRGLVADGLSTSQFISLLLIPAGLIVWIWRARRPSPAASTPPPGAPVSHRARP